MNLNMKFKFFVKGGLFLIFFSSVRSDSYFIAREEKETISPNDWGIDESFFACDRNQSCKQNVKSTAQGNEEVWDKIILKSCKEAYVNFEEEKRKYWIQHAGMSHPIMVRCINIDGKIIAVMNHDSEAKTKVVGYEEAGSYRRILTYENKIKDIIEFVETAANCKQFTRIDCLGMVTFISKKNESTGYLVDRNGMSMKYIGGGPSNSRGCACGITETCATRPDVNTTYKCNCDANLNQWKFDEGFVTEKARLPITEVRLGDTGSTTEAGYHTIGRLECDELID